MQKDDSSTPLWYPALIDWIKSAGGHVHESLVLTNQDGLRGIGCRSPISTGELLIRLPPALVLSGESMPLTYPHTSGGSKKHASPWLRCLAALYQAYSKEGDSSLQPYLDSLPKECEHLFQWSDSEVKEYLQGTTLGSIVEADRSQGTLEKRFNTVVLPYLVNTCGALSSSTRQEDVKLFRHLCMMLSTRGFHLLSSSLSDNDDTERKQQQDYSGPFLLPFIDLLNHNPAQASTTLKRDDATGAFFMSAERNIQAGEHVCHSYGHDLSSAQVLQTFGFVPDDSIHRASTWNVNTGEKNGVVTAAILSKQDIIEACHEMEESGYPLSVEMHVKKHCPGEETWKVPSLLFNRKIDLVSNDLTVVYSDTPLSSELVTLCTLLLLPDEMYGDFMSDSPALLDSSVLEDYFLGKIVCRSLLYAIDNKKTTYDNDLQSYANKLRLLYLKQCGEKSQSELRAMYGYTIRIEEMACLEKLRKQVLELMDSLDDDDAESDVHSESKGDTGKRKRDTNG